MHINIIRFGYRSITRFPSRCKVTITHRGKHPYHLISEDGKGVYGWVNASDVEDAKAESKPAPAPSGGNTAIKVGDIVQFKGGSVYASADAPTANVTRGASRCKVTITHSGKHPYHLISEDGKGVYGWVNASDVEKAATESKPAPTPSGGNTAIKVGDIVQFTGGAVYISSTASTASATKGASRCKVTVTNIRGNHPYHLVSEDGKGVYGWVDSANVTK